MIKKDSIIEFLNESKNIEQTSNYHKENLYVHTIRVAYYLYQKTASRVYVLAGLLHDTGKIQTRVKRENKGWTFYGHAKVSADNLYKYLTTDDKDYKLVKDIVANHMVFYECNGTESQIKHLTKYGYGASFIDNLKLFNDADEFACIRDESLLMDDSEYYDKQRIIFDFLGLN